MPSPSRPPRATPGRPSLRATHFSRTATANPCRTGRPGHELREPQTENQATYPPPCDPGTLHGLFETTTAIVNCPFTSPAETHLPPMADIIAHVSLRMGTSRMELDRYEGHPAYCLWCCDGNQRRLGDATPSTAPCVSSGSARTPARLFRRPRASDFERWGRGMATRPANTGIARG